jgi:hypothetical protein
MICFEKISLGERLRQSLGDADCLTTNDGIASLLFLKFVYRL